MSWMTYELAVEALSPIEYFDGIERPDAQALWVLDQWRLTLPVPFKRNKHRYGR